MDLRCRFRSHPHMWVLFESLYVKGRIKRKRSPAGDKESREAPELNQRREEIEMILWHKGESCNRVH